FRVVGGALPPGVTLDEAGRLGGTVSPEAAPGLYAVTAVAVDGRGGALVGGGAFEVLGPDALPASGCAAAPGGVGAWAWLVLRVTGWGRRRTART
ncbi:MAG: putative Ig domain-containing protein, partial [Deltaproteobacteria bacterium]|nr:putative Ig domain-containing protein [Deltaproteobacteria bacterium]